MRTVAEQVADLVRSARARHKPERQHHTRITVDEATYRWLIARTIAVPAHIRTLPNGSKRYTLMDPLGTIAAMLDRAGR